MSLVNVILAANRLQIANVSDDILSDSVTYTNIVSVNPLVATKKDEVGFVPGMDSANPYELPTTENIYWRVELHLADGRKEYIFLEDVDNQAGWTNDADGYAAAEEDIYAAFPTGGGGSGTVTSVGASGGTTGFGFSGSPVTGSGTLTLTVSNAATVQDAIGLPLSYVAAISQSGTSDPTVDLVLSNTLGITPVFARAGDGSYTVTSVGDFPVNRTYANIAGLNDGDTSSLGAIGTALRADDDTVNILTVSFPAGLAADGYLTNSILTIQVYPA